MQRFCRFLGLLFSSSSFLCAETSSCNCGDAGAPSVCGDQRGHRGRRWLIGPRADRRRGRMGSSLALCRFAGQPRVWCPSSRRRICPRLLGQRGELGTCGGDSLSVRVEASSLTVAPLCPQVVVVTYLSEVMSRAARAQHVRPLSELAELRQVPEVPADVRLPGDPRLGSETSNLLSPRRAAKASQV